MNRERDPEALPIPGGGDPGSLILLTIRPDGQGEAMTEKHKIDFGPLAELCGTWRGDKGKDVSPEPDGEELSPYYETITFTAVGDVTNAESQLLAAVHYRQVVSRKSNDEVFHHETGYWIWDAKRQLVMHSLAIPRGVCLLAGGTFDGKRDEDDRILLEVAAGLDNEEFGIVQSPFMRDNAKTTAFRHEIAVGGGRLSYQETTVVDIYGKTFDHTDQNELTLDQG